MKPFIIFLYVALYLIALIAGRPDRHKHPYGRQVAFQSFTNDNDSTFDQTGLKEIFNHPEVRDRKIVTLTIIGAYRKGKSFFLDYCLRFLYGNYKSINTMSRFVKKENWWGEPDEPLTGFSWSSGSVANTKGIQLWSDVFLHEENGEKVAIILMDTQGLFELNRSPNTDARIFGITSFISSIQILNLNDVIQENELEYLKIVTDFSRVAAKRQNSKSLTASSKLFQHLLFLFRDWSDEDVGFGYEGGKKYLRTVLNIKNNNVGAQSVRDNLRNTYEQLNAFLLPHPGKGIKNKEYDGRWSKLDADFQQYLKELIESLLKPENLIKLKVFNIELNGRELYDYAVTLLITFNSQNIPNIDSIFNIVVENELMKMAENSIDEYKKIMKGLVNYNSADFVHELNDNHTLVQSSTINKFMAVPKVSDAQLEEKFGKIIQSRTQKFFNEWKDDQFKIYSEYVEGKIRQEEAEKRAQEQFNKLIETERRLMEERKEKEIEQAKYKMRQSPWYIIGSALCNIFTFGTVHCDE